MVKILALRVFLVLVLNSTSLNQIDALQTIPLVSISSPAEQADCTLDISNHATPQARSKNLRIIANTYHFFLVLFILNNNVAHSFSFQTLTPFLFVINILN